MKCVKSRCIFMFGILNLYVAFAAPYANRRARNAMADYRDFMQGSEPKTGNEYEWFPVDEMNKPKNDLDDADENESLKKVHAAKEEAMKKVKTTTTTTTTTKATTKKPDSNYKTICEEKSGNCGFKTGPEDTLDELISRIKDVLGHENKMLENDVTELRRLVLKVSEKVHDLQKTKCSKCEGKSSPVAEIEERHVVERKLVHSKEHHDHTDHDNDHKEEKNTHHVELHMESIPKNDANRDYVPKIEATQVPILHKQASHEHLAHEPAPHSQPQPPKRLPQPHGRKQINSPTQTNEQPLVPVNFLEGVAPDVNYNGGIPRHMDDLKKEYPQGYWPKEDDTGSGTGDNESNKNNNDDTEENGKDYEEKQQVTTENILSPEYLEEIIRREQVRHQRIKTDKKHHVAEHKLPKID